MLLAVVLASGGCGGHGDEPAAPGVPTGPGACISGLFPPATLPGEYSVQCVIWHKDIPLLCSYIGNKKQFWLEVRPEDGNSMFHQKGVSAHKITRYHDPKDHSS